MQQKHQPSENCTKFSLKLPKEISAKTQGTKAQYKAQPRSVQSRSRAVSLCLQGDLQGDVLFLVGFTGIFFGQGDLHFLVGFTGRFAPCLNGFTGRFAFFGCREICLWPVFQRFYKEICPLFGWVYREIYREICPFWLGLQGDLLFWLVLQGDLHRVWLGLLTGRFAPCLVGFTRLFTGRFALFGWVCREICCRSLVYREICYREICPFWLGLQGDLPLV